MLQSPTDPPLYVASDIERRLLLQATENIIAGDDVIGSTLMQMLKNRSFVSHFNITALSAMDILKLLRGVLPGEWFWESTRLVSRPPMVTDDWLRDVWAYIISSNACEIFDGSLPLLPVFVAAKEGLDKEGGDGGGGEKCSHLVKLKPGVPLLHMMFRENMPPVVMRALASVGLFVYNPEGNYFIN